MARCCGGGTATKIVEGAGINVSGIGTSQDPFVIDADFGLSVTDTTTFDLTLSGSGTSASPYNLTVAFAATAKLDDLPDVVAPAPTNAQVLGWDSATSKWTPRAPTTAASGSVQHNTSLTGDGSAGTPLQVVPNSARYIENTASGIGINDSGVNRMLRKFATDAARTSASPVPELNSLSMLDTIPGRVDYWTGTTWQRLTSGYTLIVNNELLEMSGAYVAGGEIKVMVKQVSATTNALGEFDALDSTDLSGAGGVLFAHFQEGSIGLGWAATVIGNVDRIVGTAYRLDNGQPLASQSITGTVWAYLY